VRLSPTPWIFTESSVTPRQPQSSGMWHRAVWWMSRLEHIRGLSQNVGYHLPGINTASGPHISEDQSVKTTSSEEEQIFVCYRHHQGIMYLLGWNCSRCPTFPLATATYNTGTRYQVYPDSNVDYGHNWTLLVTNWKNINVHTTKIQITFLYTRS
jgi:hypothetical protein